MSLSLVAAAAIPGNSFSYVPVSPDTMFGASVVDTFRPNDQMFVIASDNGRAIGTPTAGLTLVASSGAQDWKGWGVAVGRWSTLSRSTPYGFDPARNTIMFVVVRGLLASLPVAAQTSTYFYADNPRPYGGPISVPASGSLILWQVGFNSNAPALSSCNLGAPDSASISGFCGMWTFAAMSSGAVTPTSLPGGGAGGGGDSWAGAIAVNLDSGNSGFPFLLLRK